MDHAELLDRVLRLSRALAGYARALERERVSAVLETFVHHELTAVYEAVSPRVRAHERAMASPWRPPA